MDVDPGRVLVARHWRLIAVVAIVAGLVAFGVSYLFSPRYTATTHLLVRANEARFLTTNGQDLQQQAGVIDGSLVKSLDQTYSSMLTSRTLSEQVVNQLHLDQRKGDTSLLGQARASVKKVYNVTKAILIHGFYAEPTPHEGAVTTVQESITAQPIQDSYMLEVSASADDPRLAAAIANAAVDEVSAEIQARDKSEANTYRDFLLTQVDKAASQVADANAAIQNYKQTNNLTDIQQQLSLNAESNQSVVDQLRKADVDLAAARAKASALSGSLNALSPTDSTTSTVTTGRSTTTLTNSGTNTIYANLRTELADAQAQIASLQAQHDALTDLLNTKSSALPAQQAELNNLQLKLDTANGAYTAIRHAYEAAQVNSADTPIEVTRVDTAAPPLYPDRPLRYLFLLVGILLGAIAGALLAWYRDRGLPGDRDELPVPQRARRQQPRVLAPQMLNIQGAEVVPEARLKKARARRAARAESRLRRQAR